LSSFINEPQVDPDVDREQEVTLEINDKSNESSLDSSSLQPIITENIVELNLKIKTFREN